MMQRSTLFVVIAALLIGLVLFRLKYKVMSLEQQHRHIKKTIQENQEAIHVLRAEWAHLNDPSRLQRLAKKYLEINPLQSSQLVSFTDVATSNGAVYDKAALEKLITAAAADQQPDRD